MTGLAARKGWRTGWLPAAGGAAVVLRMAKGGRLQPGDELPLLEGDGQLDAFRQALAAWFERHQRDLPWRRERSLYRTVVSEFMLQQTQVITVIPYFERWMRELPGFQALAAAEEPFVLKLWEGLGYYSRARNLWRLAQRVVDGGVPESIAEWLELPGVGPYAAAAIGSIAQGLPAAVVDGNVVRIVTRLYGDSTEYPNAGAAVKAVSPAATRLLNAAQPGHHNEAMMELGATVCVKARPSCLLCPVRSWCVAGRDGGAGDLPKIGRPKTENVLLRRAWVLQDGKLLLARQPSSARRLADCWELPLLEDLGTAEDLASWQQIDKRQRGISNQRITEVLLRAVDGKDGAAGKMFREPVGAQRDFLQPSRGDGRELQWIPVAALESIRLSGPHRKWITELLRRPPSFRS